MKFCNCPRLSNPPKEFPDFKFILETIHKGKTIQLWEIKVTDKEDQMISLCKLTTYSRQK